jgi:hypothetical protein
MNREAITIEPIYDTEKCAVKIETIEAEGKISLEKDTVV